MKITTVASISYGQPTEVYCPVTFTGDGQPTEIKDFCFFE
jgi:hypothetical protein